MSAPLDPGHAGRTPHLRLGEVRSPIGDQETRRALVREIAADPVKQQWLRDHGAALLRSAAVELSHAVPELDEARTTPAKLVERRAGEHERGETALW